jgi:hypothetical protein
VRLEGGASVSACLVQRSLRLQAISLAHLPRSAMTCKTCKVRMKELKGHIYHKKRKWRCPTCDKVRMQKPK